MTLTKNQWIIVVVVALIVIWYFFIRKKPTSGSESGYTKVPYAVNVPQPCNCLKKLPDGSTAYGRYQNGCNFQTNCFPPTTLKDNAGKN